VSTGLSPWPAAGRTRDSALSSALCRRPVAARVISATGLDVVPYRFAHITWGRSCGPVPLLAALVVFDHPPSAFISWRDWWWSKIGTGEKVVVVVGGG
jgi:hypothetical protein